MKFSEWLKPDTLAILCHAIYYGVPSQGHPNCYKEMIADKWSSHEQVTDREPLKGILCIGCGKPLLKEQEVPAHV